MSAQIVYLDPNCGPQVDGGKHAELTSCLRPERGHSMNLEQPALHAGYFGGLQR
jgi:hypothetical protein